MHSFLLPVTWWGAAKRPVNTTPHIARAIKLQMLLLQAGSVDCAMGTPAHPLSNPYPALVTKVWERLREDRRQAHCWEVLL